MKKNQLYAGVGLILAGAALLALYILLGETRFTSYCAVLACNFAIFGIVLIGKYIYWSRPERAPVYEQRLKQEHIELRDERKVMLRERSGLFMYQLTVILLPILAAVIALTSRDRLALLLLCLFWILEIVGGRIAYRRLEKKL